MASNRLQGPKGTRDLYPEETARVRYIQKAWTDTAVRHGFEEIEGPTFETSELYAVKSGEGILGELFQAFSGKSPEEIEEVQKTGRAPFALRPEFTPTLARMYAARAKQLQKPTKWFTAGPYFRAERPQRGRLREFLQWNVDVIGEYDTLQARAEYEEETVTTAVGLFKCLGLTHRDVSIGLNHRDCVAYIVEQSLSADVARKPDAVTAGLELLDRCAKVDQATFEQSAKEIGLRTDKLSDLVLAYEGSLEAGMSAIRSGNPIVGGDSEKLDEFRAQQEYRSLDELYRVLNAGLTAGVSDWVSPDSSIVRGLAYYTGTVFEAIADGERAVAGGGRYDNLIELMGGPPTPAVGFAMGDVVLGLLLEDKGLMPEGAELLDAISAPGASRRPEVFVVSADDEATDALARRLVADLRRGVESQRARDEGLRPWRRERYEPATGGVRPVHARQSYKSTKNLKKLLGDAERQFSRFAAVVHGEDRVQLRDLDRRKELTPRDVPGLPDGVAEFSVDPSSAVYVGRALAALIDA